MINYLAEGYARQSMGQIRLRGLNRLPTIMEAWETAYPADLLPSTILQPLAPGNHAVYSRIENDYKGVSRHALSNELMAMIILDSHQLADEALFYFLPALLLGVVNGYCHHGGFLRRRLLKAKTSDKHVLENLRLARIILLEVERILRLMESDEQAEWQNGV